MKKRVVLILVAFTLAISFVIVRQNARAQESRSQSGNKTVRPIDDDGGAKIADREQSPTFVHNIPEGYRDWTLISVAREAGELDDIRAILGNDIAIQAFREGKRPFPDGAIIARLAWAHVSSDENNKAFGREQSFVAGAPKNGVQFMIKDAKKYAVTGGWGYGQFNDGKSADEALLRNCYPCHQAIQARDFVFTNYAP